MIEMGVYHVSGLGTSPGALTMPLTCVYILRAAARLGHNGASNFFALSGERERKGSYEKNRGEPEAIIAFDSKEAIEGKLKLNYQSNWFRMTGGKQEAIGEPIKKYLCKLLDHLNKILEREGAGGLNHPGYFYLIGVDYQDFEDVLDKAGLVFHGLRRKEVWVNLIGGSNQINLALMLAGNYTMVPSRYYYVFQNELTLEPSWVKGLPQNARDIKKAADRILDEWRDILPINLGFGPILNELGRKFFVEKKKLLSKREVINILAKNGYTEKFLPKLITSGYIVPEGEDAFKAGPTLERIAGDFSKFPEYQNSITDFGKVRENLGDSIKEVEFKC
ncbi:hypothetical protein E3E38_09305 [Thermococcus sp. 18S1]|uniref:hypothetical protein n=1 Tax=Thermococcus sp. 18S1 TaxID=1638210 RepID=UPI001439BC17|nr:hypothetical protein [Thermococcus sp. 18S1]NJE31237.1 hypothetical protein [Thermococcus sp. 18S1]